MERRLVIQFQAWKKCLPYNFLCSHNFYDEKYGKLFVIDHQSVKKVSLYKVTLDGKKAYYANCMNFFCMK